MSHNETVTLAHLSDVHLPLTAGFSPRLWNIKRALGWVNWQRKRRFVHRQDALDALVADMRAQAPDHVLVSGDLVNIGLPTEYRRAASWLSELGSPDRVSVVPGNHDAYVAGEAERGVSHWSDYMASDAYGQSLGAFGEPMMGAAFPYVRQIGPVAVIGVNSGIPTRPGSAAGEVGPLQMAALAHVLEATEKAGLVRLVMIHHPPVPGLATGARGLRDSRDFAGTLERHGADLVIHGHNHQMMSSVYAGIAIEGVASASAARAQGHEPPARYNLIRVATRGTGREITIETRGARGAGEPIRRIASRTLLRQSVMSSAFWDKRT
jgi:3',5'-cyclic AMP phosphodiesterase CpdA